MKAGDIVPLLKESYSEWSDDKASRLAAALAYYTAFSLAPLLLIAVAIAGFFFKQSDAQAQLQNQIKGLIGPQGGDIVTTMLSSGSTQSGNIIATIIGIITLLIGATGVFVQLQDSLNTIWEVKLDPNLGIKGTIKQRISSLVMVLGVGFLLLVSLIISTVISGVTGFITGGGGDAQSTILTVVVWIINFLVGFAVTTLLFAAIFKYVPDVEIQWSDVWVGALFTALLFSIGRFALSYYLGRGSFTSTYGAAASLVILLAWIYYSSLILFFGAEFTQVYASKFGSRIVPEKDAVPVTEEERAQQGMTRDSGSQPRGAQKPDRRPAPPRAPQMQQPPASATSIGVAGFIAGVLAGRRSKSRK